MTSRHQKKEGEISYEIRQINNAKDNETILETEKVEVKKEDISADGANQRDSSINLIERFRQNAGLFVIFVLLALSLIQSVELFNLKKEIQKGQFVGGSNPASAVPQGLPSQQGGC